MIKKSLKSFLSLVAVLLVVASTPLAAGRFEISGPGTQVGEQDLEGNDQVKPGGVITVTISNNRPGYQRMFIYITGDDGNGNDVMLWGTAVGGDNCRPGTSCVFDVPNVPQHGLTADELYVEGYFGQAGSRAVVEHYTVNP